MGSSQYTHNMADGPPRSSHIKGMPTSGSRGGGGGPHDCAESELLAKAPCGRGGGGGGSGPICIGVGGAGDGVLAGALAGAPVGVGIDGDGVDVGTGTGNVGIDGIGADEGTPWLGSVFSMPDQETSFFLGHLPSSGCRIPTPSY